MADNIPTYEHRFGISLLSKKNKDKAYPEEVMIDKDTGEIVVKTSDEGDVVSFNAMARRQQAIERMKLKSNNLNVFGNIYEIESNYNELPFKLSNGSTFEPFFKNNEECKLMELTQDRFNNNSYPTSVKLLFDIDADSLLCYEHDGVTKYEHIDDFIVRIGLTIEFNTDSSFKTLSTSFSISTSELNNKPYVIHDDTNRQIKSITFTNIRLINITEANYRIVRTILYNLLILVEDPYKLERS